MKIAIAAFLSLVVGFGLGWISFRSQEVAEFKRNIQKAGFSEDFLIEAYKELPTVLDNMEVDDRKTAIISLAALRFIEVDRIDQAKKILADQAASYFVIYGPPNHPTKKMTEDRLSTLHAIERAREESSFLDAAVKQSIDNINK